MPDAPPSSIEASTAVGSVRQLWRYPVKSMRGERCEHLVAEARGVVGDRKLAVRTLEGRLGSGKMTRRFARIDGLIEFGATLSGSVASIHFPDGRCMQDDDPLIHDALSNTLGHSLELVRETDAVHVDEGPVHVLTTGSLAWLQAALPDAMLEPRRFRPNLLLDVAHDAPVEQEWIGRALLVGPDVVLRVSLPTERCRMISFAQGGLPDDPRILRHVAQHADTAFGVYADVIVPGRISEGDAVRLASDSGAKS